MRPDMTREGGSQRCRRCDQASRTNRSTDDDARYLADLASQVLGIRRSHAEQLAERYVRELPGSGWERFLRWIADDPRR
jgi:16S rRNA C967 or C1407 C5-methylase (RsmB/RsmF family)